MKKYLFIITMFTVYSIRASCLPDDIVIEEQEQKCYICGRTIQDFAHIHAEVLNQLEDQLNLRTQDNEDLGA